MTSCPICGGEVGVKAGTVVSELIDCDECASELEVTSLDPLTLVEAPEVAEDWGE